MCVVGKSPAGTGSTLYVLQRQERSTTDWAGHITSPAWLLGPIWVYPSGASGDRIYPGFILWGRAWGKSMWGGDCQ